MVKFHCVWKFDMEVGIRNVSVSCDFSHIATNWAECKIKKKDDEIKKSPYCQKVNRKIIQKRVIHFDFCCCFDAASKLRNDIDLG